MIRPSQLGQVHRPEACYCNYESSEPIDVVTDGMNAQVSNPRVVQAPAFDT
jgi:hypothetical protein